MYTMTRADRIKDEKARILFKKRELKLISKQNKLLKKEGKKNA